MTDREFEMQVDRDMQEEYTRQQNLKRLKEKYSKFTIEELEIELKKEKDNLILYAIEKEILIKNIDKMFSEMEKK